MVGGAVEQRGGHFGVAEYRGPFAECQIGGDDHRGLFVELAHQVEQQLASGTGERQIAQFIEHDEFDAAELGRKCAGLADARLILKPRDQIDGVEVAATGAGAHDTGGNGDGQVGLAGSGAADQHDVASARQE